MTLPPSFLSRSQSLSASRIVSGVGLCFHLAKLMIIVVSHLLLWLTLLADLVLSKSCITVGEESTVRIFEIFHNRPRVESQFQARTRVGLSLCWADMITRTARRNVSVKYSDTAT